MSNNNDELPCTARAVFTSGVILIVIGLGVSIGAHFAPATQPGTNKPIEGIFPYLLCMSGGVFAVAMGWTAISKERR